MVLCILFFVDVYCFIVSIMNYGLYIFVSELQFNH